MKAFPVQIEHFEDYEGHLQKGMDLRDHFAGLAMQGMLSNGVTIDIDKSMPFLTRAKAAYMIADAMMEARKQNEDTDKPKLHGIMM